jgi:hypothetical protein
MQSFVVMANDSNTYLNTLFLYTSPSSHNARGDFSYQIKGNWSEHYKIWQADNNNVQCNIDTDMLSEEDIYIYSDIQYINICHRDAAFHIHTHFVAGCVTVNSYEVIVKDSDIKRILHLYRCGIYNPSNLVTTGFQNRRFFKDLVVTWVTWQPRLLTKTYNLLCLICDLSSGNRHRSSVFYRLSFINAEYIQYPVNVATNTPWVSEVHVISFFTYKYCLWLL